MPGRAHRFPARPGALRRRRPVGGEIYRGSFAPDGDTFYFFKAVGAPESYRIYASRRSRGRWNTPERVSLGGEHSDLYPSIGYDVFPFFSPDGRELYFVRDFRAFYRIGMAEALASVVSACP